MPFTYVNDGVCDYDLCCDGSEEFGHKGGVKCENRCVVIGKEYRQKEDERRRNMERAGKKRKTMAKEAKELRRRAAAKLDSLAEEIAVLDAKTRDLEAKYKEVQRQDKGKVVRGADDSGRGGKLAVLVGLAKTRVDELRNTLEKVVAQRDGLQERMEELETILRKFREEYNPNFNDEGVKAAVKSWEDYAAREETNVQDEMPDSEISEIVQADSETSGVNWKEFEEGDGDDTDVCEWLLGC